MSTLHQSFNQSALSHFLNRGAGRIFRIIAGMVFLILGYVYHNHFLGILAMVWGVFPLSAGAFDICYISVLLGGPISGAKIRANYKEVS